MTTKSIGHLNINTSLSVGSFPKKEGSIPGIDVNDTFSAQQEKNTVKDFDVARKLLLKNKINADDGVATLWERNVEEPVTQKPVMRNDGSIVVCSSYKGNSYMPGKSKIRIIDPESGDLKWEMPLEGEIKASPSIAGDGSILTATGRGKVIRLNGDTGETEWSAFVPGAVVETPVEGKNGTIFVTTDRGMLHALDGSTGKEKWNFRDSSRKAHITAPAVDEEGDVYFSSDSDGKFFALDGKTGEQKWEVRHSGGNIFPPILASKDLLIAGSQNGHHLIKGCTLYGLDPKNGDKKWKKKTNFINIKPVMMDESTLLVASCSHKLEALDVNSGEKKWEIYIGKAMMGLDYKDGTAFILKPKFEDCKTRTHLQAIDTKTKKVLFDFLPQKGDPYTVSAGENGAAILTGCEKTLMSVRDKASYIKSAAKSASQSSQSPGEKPAMTISEEDKVVNIAGVRLDVRNLE